MHDESVSPVSPPKPVSDRSSRVIVAVFIIALGLGYGWVAPAESQTEMIDHHAFMRTVSLMRYGTDYYAAMDRALREVCGPVESVRAFRLPTLFWFWQLLPSARLDLGDLRRPCRRHGVNAAEALRVPPCRRPSWSSIC